MTLTEAFGSVADTLANMGPEIILKMKAAPEINERVAELTEKKKDGIISEEESSELERFLALDTLISLAKARARKLLAA